MRIAFFEPEGWEKPLIDEHFTDHAVFYVKDRLDKTHIPEIADLDAISIFIDSRIDRDILERLPNLKLITTRSTGFDHIDLAACKERGITVSYVPEYGNNTVAEFTFGLILSLTRRIYQSIDQIKEAEKFSLKGLRGMDIKGKRIGIVGMGRIGREVAKVAKGFGMEVIAYDPYPNEAVAREIGLEFMSLEDMLKNADIVSIHCPYTPNTHHLMNEETMKLLKHGAYLVNTSRGSIVETAAVIDALKNGTLAGFATDVLEEEGETKDELRYLIEGRQEADAMRVMLQNHILMHMKNALVTPHNAFNSHEALERILLTTFENIDAFIKGAPMNVVPGSK